MKKRAAQLPFWSHSIPFRVPISLKLKGWQYASGDPPASFFTLNHKCVPAKTVFLSFIYLRYIVSIRWLIGFLGIKPGLVACLQVLIMLQICSCKLEIPYLHHVMTCRFSSILQYRCSVKIVSVPRKCLMLKQFWLLLFYVQY